MFHNWRTNPGSEDWLQGLSCLQHVASVDHGLPGFLSCVQKSSGYIQLWRSILQHG